MPPHPATPVLIITGANGYIGRAVVAAALNAGIEVHTLARRDAFAGRTRFHPYDLTAANDLTALPQGATLIHLAQQTRASKSEANPNLPALQQLCDWTQMTHSRLIFTSSQTARADAPTLYGRDKWQAELLVRVAGGITVRPGLVYGGAPMGLYGVLCALVKTLPILPAFRPAPLVQPITVDELAAGLLRIAALEQCAPLYCLGSATPVSFTAFLRQLAITLGRKRSFIPVPRSFLSVLFALDRILPKAIRLKMASLKSLFDLPMMDTRASLDALGIDLKKPVA